MSIISTTGWLILTKRVKVIEDYKTCQETLELFYTKFQQDMLERSAIQEFIQYYQLDQKLGINETDMFISLFELKLLGKRIDINDYKTYKKMLGWFYAEIQQDMLEKNMIQGFIRYYQLDIKLNITFNDVRNDLTKIEYTGEIGTITDTESYKNTLELYYIYNDMFNKEMIQEFIDIYHLDMKLNIDFSNVFSDLTKMMLEDEIGIITDNQSYLKALELYYDKFDEDILFDENIICKFINTFHLDTRLHITSDDVWNDLAKIKRQSKLEDKLINEIGTIKDIESYKEALELYYNIFGEDMFEISKVQNFIDTFKLDEIDITPNRVYRDLRAIKRAFETENEIPYNNFTSLQPDIKSRETITPPVQPQDKQNQTISNIPTEEDNHDNLEKKGVDKDFGKRNQKHGDFYFYVVNMSDTQLINTINGQYKAIKDAWSLAPRMGEYGSIEFAATLLLWEYALRNFKSNPTEYGSLLITLGDMIGCSFFGMPAGEWSDNVDPILNAHPDILTRDEFGSVYNYLRNNYADEIHSMEFNKGNANEEVYTQLYMQFLRVYNTRNNFSETLDFYARVGLKIKDNFLFNVGS